MAATLTMSCNIVPAPGSIAVDRERAPSQSCSSTPPIRPAGGRPVMASVWAALLWGFWILGLLSAGGAALAQTDLIRQFDERLVQWAFSLDQAEFELERETSDRQRMDSVRLQVARVERETQEVVNQVGSRVAEQSKLLDALGPQPGPDGPLEDATVANERFKLEEMIVALQGRAQQAGLVAARANQILEKLSKRSRLELAQRLYRRGPSPLSGRVLKNALPHLVYVLRQLWEAPLEAWAPAATQPGTGRQLVPLATLIVVAFVVLWPARRALLRRFKRDDHIAQPSFMRRVLAAVAVGLARGVIPSLIALAPLALLIREQDTQTRGLVADILVATLIAIIISMGVSGVARAALAPYSPRPWRMTPLSNASALRLYRRIVVLATVVALFFLVRYPVSLHLTIPDGLGNFYDFIGNTLTAMLILTLLPAGLWRGDWADDPKAAEAAKQGRRSRLNPSLRLGAAILAISVPVVAVLGYRNLANFLAQNLIATGMVLGLAAVLHGLARDGFTLLLHRELRSWATVTQTKGPVDPNTRLLQFWLLAAFDLFLLLVTTVVLLPVWGVAWVELQEWLRRALTGIKIGSFTFALTDLFAAIAAFVVILAATRWLQRLLEERILPQTTLDVGVRHSVKVATGYAGLILAVAVAVGALGLDLSNLALIAGALSVGIGFGLQNIVNNFVSGLILLAERPVKVGDWVVVGNHQGYVSRINVRATEIQTFQRSAVIIPNSELLSSAVENWTHRDSYARVDVAVGVAYGSDLQQVKAALMQCAEEHPKVNRWPEPHVLFADFGDSALNLELRCYISDALYRIIVASDLRFAIDAAFAQANIEIPFPQRVVHWSPATPSGPPGAAA